MLMLAVLLQPLHLRWLHLTGLPVSWLRLLQDCNLVLYTAANSAIWNSNTYNPANAPCTLSVLSAVGGYIEIDTSAGAAVFRQPPNPGALKTGQQLPQVDFPLPHLPWLRSGHRAVHASCVQRRQCRH